jgi:hypothetical protein
MPDSIPDNLMRNLFERLWTIFLRTRTRRDHFVVLGVVPGAHVA